MPASPIKPGIYRHYKDKLYQVYDVARHSETEALFVLYRPLYGERQLWVRPLEMFLDEIEIVREGVACKVPRFAWYGPAESEVC